MFVASPALSCPNGAFPTKRLNDIRDLTVELMLKVCHDVSKEPSLQPLSGEPLSLRTCNRDDGVRLDTKASSFWGGQFQYSFFDVHIFNPYAPLNRSNPYCQHEGAKCRAYEERVCEIEHASLLLCFPPLEAWVPPLQLLISVWLFFCPSSGRLRIVR